MNHMQDRFLRYAVTLALLLPFSSTLARAEKWIEPTAEELKMTSQPEVPGLQPSISTARKRRMTNCTFSASMCA